MIAKRFDMWLSSSVATDEDNRMVYRYIATANPTLSYSDVTVQGGQHPIFVHHFPLRYWNLVTIKSIDRSM